MLRLIVESGSARGRTVEVIAETTVGRSADNAVVIDDSAASSRHCAVRPGAAGFELEDFGSTNGTFVNGERISGRRALADGDSIRIGETTLRVQHADSPVVGLVPTAPIGRTKVIEAGLPVAVSAVGRPPVGDDLVLIVRAGPDRGTTVPIPDGSTIVIGRDADSDLALSDSLASGHHVRIVRAGAVVRLTDLGSTNGTALNGVTVTGESTLGRGDEIKIGTTVIICSVPGAEAGRAAPKTEVAGRARDAKAPGRGASRSRPAVVATINWSAPCPTVRWCPRPTAARS